MQAGRMDRRIIIQQNVPTKDDIGGVDESWTIFATVWANVKTLESGGQGESFGSEQVFSQDMKKFSIRYLSNITNKMRIVFDGGNFDIKFTKEIGRREGLLITAESTN